MNRNLKKAIIIGILATGLAAAGIGYYLYNKGPVNVASSSGIPVTSDALYSAYLADTTTAQKNYSGKILEVTGEIKEISLNQQNEQVILVKTGTEGGHINCTMENNHANLTIGQKVTVKGICSGMGAGDPDLGIMGDVYLTRSVLSK